MIWLTVLKDHSDFRDQMEVRRSDRRLVQESRREVWWLGPR